MSEMPIRVVLDTNLIIAAGTRWLDDGVPATDSNIHRKILIRVAETHTGLYCGKIIGEYLEKLVDFQRHPQQRLVKLIAYIMGAFSSVNITTAIAPYRPVDLDDEIFILCAIDGAANFLVSDDSHLLSLKPKYPSFVIGPSAELATPLGCAP